MLGGNIDFEILDATFGGDLVGRERQFCRDLYCARAFRDMSLNEIACSLSHKMALERFLQSEAEHGLILEDDAHITLDDFGRIPTLLAAVPEFDVLKVGGYCGGLAPGKVVYRRLISAPPCASGTHRRTARRRPNLPVQPHRSR